MKTYKIGLIWQMYGYVEVEANSLAEAIHIVHSTDVPLPENGEYIEGSFEVDYSAVEVSDESWNN